MLDKLKNYVLPKKIFMYIILLVIDMCVSITHIPTLFSLVILCACNTLLSRINLVVHWWNLCWKMSFCDYSGK